MSKSVTATSNDVNSIYWNPAGLANVKHKQAALMHTSHFAGIANYDYAAYASTIEDNDGIEGNETVYAISLIRFGVDDILNTTTLIDANGNIDYSRISLFSAVDYALNFAFAKPIYAVDNLNVGFNAKLIRRKIGDFASATGLGLDAGLQYKLNSWQFGIMVRDLTTTFNLWKINEEGFELIKNAIPGENQESPETIEITLPKLHIGIAKNFKLKNKDYALLTEVDLHTRFAQTNDLISTTTMSMTPSLGLQLDYKKYVFLRAGVGNFQKIKKIDQSESISFQPNVGLGFHYHGIQIDYALSNIASVGNALYSNTFSLKIDFNYFKK